MDYNLYLFSNIVKLYNADFNNLEYDLQFEQLPSMYDDFLNSSFNDSKFGEYDCIAKYLIYKYGEKQERKISIVWSVEDVYGRAKDCGYELTEEEALKVLQNLKDKHDAEIGINWDVIDSMISYIVPNSQFEEERFCRKCAVSGIGINKGWLIGDDWYSTKEMADKIAIEEGFKSFADMYNKSEDSDFCYYTEFDDIDEEIENQGEYYTSNGDLIEL